MRVPGQKQAAISARRQKPVSIAASGSNYSVLARPEMNSVSAASTASRGTAEMRRLNVKYFSSYLFTLVFFVRVRLAHESKCNKWRVRTLWKRDTISWVGFLGGKREMGNYLAHGYATFTRDGSLGFAWLFVLVPDLLLPQQTRHSRGSLFEVFIIGAGGALEDAVIETRDEPMGANLLNYFQTRMLPLWSETCCLRFARRRARRGIFANVARAADDRDERKLGSTYSIY